MTRYRTAPLTSSAMPSGIPFIVGNEAAERFSFYGMRIDQGGTPHIGWQLLAYLVLTSSEVMVSIPDWSSPIPRPRAG